MTRICRSGDNGEIGSSEVAQSMARPVCTKEPIKQNNIGNDLSLEILSCTVNELDH